MISIWDSIPIENIEIAGFMILLIG